MSNYKEQLADFRQDNSYFSEYPETITKPEHALLRFFEFRPKVSKELTKKEKKFREALIIPGSKPGDKETVGAFSVGAQVTNIAKVIKASKDSKFKSGDIVILGYEKVRGSHENGELTAYMRAQAAKSTGGQSLDIIPPEDFRKRIPNIERHLARFMYKNANHNEIQPQDRLTYLIPDLEILTKE